MGLADDHSKFGFKSFSALKKGVLQFLERPIYRERDGESSLSLGVSEACMVGIMDIWHEKLKPTEVSPKLVDSVKSKKEGDAVLTPEARYCRVLGQLAWAVLSRADLCFYVPFLVRFQSKPMELLKLACVLCCAGCSRVCMAFRLCHHQRVLRQENQALSWSLRCVMECGISIWRRTGIPRLLREGFLPQTGSRH
eukprot:s101_g42.t1